MLPSHPTVSTESTVWAVLALRAQRIYVKLLSRYPTFSDREYKRDGGPNNKPHNPLTFGHINPIATPRSVPRPPRSLVPFRGTLS